MRFTYGKHLHAAGYVLEEDAPLEAAILFARTAPAVQLPVFVIETAYGWFVTPETPEFPQPDKAAPEAAFLIVHADKVEKYDLAGRYDRCTQLIKVMGCYHCDLRGPTCLKEGGLVELPPGKDFDVDEVKKLHRKNGGLKFGEFEFIAPAHTTTDRFPEEIRFIQEHAFDDETIEEARRVRREKSENAAQTRKEYKDNCSRCIFGHKRKSGYISPGCSRRPRYCKGPFADDATQVKAIIEEWDPRVEKFLAEQNFTERQFWTVAEEASEQGTYNRKQTYLSGWLWTQARGFHVGAFRAKTKLYPVDVEMRTYGEVRDVFRGLPRVMGLRGERPKDELRAIWYITLQSNYISQRNGWGTRDRAVVWRQLYHGQVRVQTASDWYLSYGDYSFTTLYQTCLTMDVMPPVKLESTVRK